MELTPKDAEFLARGYAWGRADSPDGEVKAVMRGIEFGFAFGRHVANGNGSYWSVQRAYDEWNDSGTINGVSYPM
jgi:hypothetical protein